MSSWLIVVYERNNFLIIKLCSLFHYVERLWKLENYYDIVWKVSDGRRLVTTDIGDINGDIEDVSQDPRIVAIAVDSLNGYADPAL